MQSASYVHCTTTNLNCNPLDQTLMDTHLKHVPGLAALSVRSLSGRDLQALSGQTHRTLDPQTLALGALNELRTHFLERLHLARGQGDADFVDFLPLAVLLDCDVRLTGPSPKSFSPFWYDMLCGANHDLNSKVR